MYAIDMFIRFIKFYLEHFLWLTHFWQQTLLLLLDVERKIIGWSFMLLLEHLEH